MQEPILLSTAYFPPLEYFSLIAHNPVVMIEKWENFLKQTYRNRCVILGTNGPLTLTVPVLRGSFHKTALKELEIDNRRRWRDHHLRSIISACANAPFFEYYFDLIESVIRKPFRFLIDLNTESLSAVCGAVGIKAEISFTEIYQPQKAAINDYRYLITPKRPSLLKGYHETPYIQVFREKYGFVPRLSIIDALLNNGPGTGALVLRSLENKQLLSAN
ncbi:MAG: WbqC family protein [Bacteroidales bacterium]|nr:WbqC family protein [Bacteroidales bacterium]